MTEDTYAIKQSLDNIKKHLQALVNLKVEEMAEKAQDCPHAYEKRKQALFKIVNEDEDNK